jgi:hypothetical protein
MHARRWTSVRVGAALAVFAAACQSPPPAKSDASADTGESAGFPIHGSLGTRYVGRFTDGAQDQDLTEVVAVDLGDPKKNTVTGFVLAEGLADLDGTGSDPDGTFHSLADTYDRAITGKLYHAYADVHATDALEMLRIGRQAIVDTPLVAYFDGLRAETREFGTSRFRFGAYGGIPVETYASSSPGDAMLGLFGETRPWSGGRIRADYMHVNDEGLLGPRRDDLLGFGGSQNIGKSMRFDAQLTRLEDEPRDVRLRGTYYAQESDLVLQASWYRLLEPQGDLAVPFDPFYETLFELFPYSQVGFLASKSLGEHLDVQAGLDLRRLDQEADIGTYNHEFNRFFATTGIRGVLPASLDLSLTGEYWDSTTNNIQTYGADLSRKIGTGVEAAIGTYYSLFKYDLYQQRELDDVRTYYVKVDWQRSERTRFDVRYEFEDDPDAEYHSVRLGVTWRF